MPKAYHLGQLWHAGAGCARHAWMQFNGLIVLLACACSCIVPKQNSDRKCQLCAERTDGDRVAEPVDSVVSSPGAYGALSAIYAALAVPAALFPHSVCVSVLMHLPGILHQHTPLSPLKP
jgi:hypothetical protein